MASQVPLNLALIRSRECKKIAEHVLHLLSQRRHIDICKALLSAVNDESIEPQVFSIVLSATKAIECIILCLRQPHSLFIRRQALKQYGKAISDVTRWTEAWNALGSTQGILQYLSEVSVWEVKRFFQHVGRSSGSQNKSAERSLAIEELLKAMYPGLYPDSQYKTLDKRPLESYAIALVPACSLDFVQDLLRPGERNQLYKLCVKSRLIKSHGNMLRQYTMQATFDEKVRPTPDDTHIYLSAFCTHEPPVASHQAKLSASMEFSKKLIESRIKHMHIPFPTHASDVDIYVQLLKRCHSKKLAKPQLHDIFSLGMHLLAAKRSLNQTFSVPDNLFWLPVTLYWGKWPEHWEDLFVQGLTLGLGGSAQNVADSFLKLAIRSEVKPDRTWKLLRLFCLYAVKDGVDIEKDGDFRTLAKLRWTVQALQKLPNEKVIYLLSKLLRVNQNFDFLHGASHESILNLQHVYDQHNFNALLLLTDLQVRSSDSTLREQAQQRVDEMFSQMKKKSASSREQQERAQYAKAAGFVAIASGSLVLFQDFVAWLQRFIRDPLTAKVVFSATAIASQEASRLLSAIPDADDGGFVLDQISKQVTIANDILLTLHKHQQLAKREPSYQDYDWHGVSALLQDTVKKRIARARNLQQSLDASQGQLYSAIWSQTFAMFSQVGIESMWKVQHDMQDLMTQLPPKTLATTTHEMLETDNRYRATKSAGKEVEDESRVIEGLSYQCLLALAKGDKPSLAEELIVRTIIDRPDASSWHRQMLSISFFKRLPAKNAEHLLLSFAQAIGEKLEEQSYERIGEPAGSPSLVKVTTVKYLAQLLQDAQFLSPEAAINVLLELFKVATHPDIRFATLESMLSTLNTLCASELRGTVIDISEIENPLIHKILAALDTVIPVVGSINERRPPREQDFTEAQEDLSKLPEPNESEPLLWHALKNAALSSKNLKSYFLDRLLLPVVKVSTHEHRKWLSLFLRKHNASISVQELPPVPIDPAMTGQLLRSFPTLVPVDALRQTDAYVQFLLNQPRGLTKFLARLKSDQDVREKADVRHFLSVFDRSTDHVLQTTFALINLIHHSWKPSKLAAERALTVQHVQAAIVRHFNILLDRYDGHLKLWDTLINQLRITKKHRLAQEDYHCWARDCRPLMKQTIDIINAKRSPAWLRDPERKPSILPSTAKLELWLLNYPTPGMDAVERQKASRLLGGQIVEWLSSQHVAKQRTRNVNRLTEDVLTIGETLSHNEMLHAAVIIGAYPSNTSADEALTRTIVAKELIVPARDEIRKLDEKDLGLKAELRKMLVDMWQSSPEEDIREVYVQWKAQQPTVWDAIVKLSAEKKHGRKISVR